MATYPATYQSADAALIQPVAARANGDLAGLGYIPGWNLLAAESFDGLQVIVTTVTLPSDGNQYAVLAMGQPWEDILGPNYFSALDPTQGGYALTQLASSLAGNATALFCDAYQQQYLQAEKDLFTLLTTYKTQLGSLPLVFTGQAQGAPLAQLAALAFRSGRSGLPVQGNTAACYTFSTPPLGDQDFDTWFLKTVPAAFNVFAQNVDFFATPVTPLPGAVSCGQSTPLKSAIPSPDDPWTEHSGAFYTTLLGGTPSGSSTAGSVQSPPTTFSSNLAFTLTQLCAVAYQQTQHPDLAPSPSLASYALDSLVSYDGTTWAAIFVNAPNQRVVVAFRGATCFEETVACLTVADLTYPSYLSGVSLSTGKLTPGTAILAAGIGDIYTGMRAALLSQLAGALKKAGGSQILVAGHDVGGAFANVAALDLAQNSGHGGLPTVTVAGVYTFAAPPGGDQSFQGAFDLVFSANPNAPTSFQITRPVDPFPGLTVVGGDLTANPALTLTGTTPWDDQINHSLTSYQLLFDPN